MVFSIFRYNVMKHTASKAFALLALLLALLPVSCTQNDGHIGDWFGTWRLEEILVDGQPDADYAHNLIWKFQSDIVSIVEVNDAEHLATSTWGTWSEENGEILRLNFTYSDNDNTNDSSTYSPPAQLHLPAGISNLEIIDLSSGKISLRYVASEATYTYILKKHG